MATKFNTLYSHSVSKPFTFTQPSSTEQSFAYETNINNIVNKAVQSSLPPNAQRPLFGTKFSPDSYNEAINLIADAKSSFESLPSNIRQRFENNPHKLLEFISDDKNYDEAVKLGFIEKKVINNTGSIKNPTEVTTEPVKPVVSQVSSD